MKQKLLFLTLFVQCICYSQISIDNFFSVPASYNVVTSSVAIDQSAVGENLTWNFTNLTQTGNTEDVHSAPTSSETTIYPGTTLVITTTDGNSNEGKFFIKETMSNEVSVTGFVTPDLTLNYSTDNALLGSYPISYSDAAVTDTSAGNYSYTAGGNTYAGTFTGTVETSVNAYGTLTTNDLGQGGFSGTVTRVKSIQNLTLMYPVFGNIGTGTLTSHSYYDDNNNGYLIFRSTRFELNVSIPTIITINEDRIVYESVLSDTLGVDQNEFISDDEVKIAPNPVGNFLNLHTSNQVIKSILVTDATGKQVLKSYGENTSLPVSNLQTGFYIANITTEDNHFTLKFIKK